jgi:hypothetical protein
MYESDPISSTEIKPEQAAAFVEAVKNHLPNLMPEAFLAEELVATWLEVNPSADPEVARQAFKDHVSLAADSQHRIDNTLIFLEPREVDDDVSTDLRVMQMYQLGGDCLTFSSWTRVVNNRPLYTRDAGLTDNRGEPTETTIEGFLEKARSEDPEVVEVYERFMQEIVAPDANVFSQQVWSEAMEWLQQLSPDNKLPDIEEL